MNPYYPIFLNLTEQKVLVIGGGKVAERKVRSLLKCHARVQVISPDLTVGLEKVARAKGIRCRKRRFVPSDLDGFRLVICATDDPAINRSAYDHAKQKGIFCNVVDAPDLCNFIVPSVIRRGDLTVAVSTGGSSPALARKVREEVGLLLGPEYREFLALLRKVRPLIQHEIPDKGRRTRIYRELVDTGAQKMLRLGRRREAREEISKVLRRYSVPSPKWPHA